MDESNKERLIEGLLSRDLTQPIEEIIKVDQYDEQMVYSEITEYIATDRIKEHYRYLLKSISESPADPHGDFGIWISGFFGSGKSSFAKNLGYVMANPQVKGRRFSDLFRAQLDDRRIGEFLDYVNLKLPTEVIMFDVSKATEVRSGEEKIAEIVYRRLLSHLGYAEDYAIAELEIEMEGEGRLDEFVALSPEVNGLEWSRARKGAKKINYASSILHRMDPQVFPQADSWARSRPQITLTVEKVVDRAFELMARRLPGRALFIIMDEVGQYVARSEGKIEDLRALVEQFGKVSRSMLKSRQVIAPVWIAVTSQEKLEEVVAAIDSRKVELAKLQDRFQYRVDLAPADIREVATRRVLAKTEEGLAILRKMYDDYQGQLNLALRLERTSRRTEVDDEAFLQCYPYPPHFVEMSIHIMSGIRLQPGADRHLGGSNRTIIKQAYEMLVNERTALARRPVGTLVTMDRIFDLVEGNLSSERRKTIHDVMITCGDDGGMAVRVAKAVCLMEFIKDVPRTEANIAACLVGEMGMPGPLNQVREALKLLKDATFVGEGDEGWKLLSPVDVSWEKERRSLAPRPRDRNEIMKDALAGIFSEQGVGSYRFRNLKTFKVGVGYNGMKITDGQLALSLISSEDGGGFKERLEAVRAESRLDSHHNEIYFVFSLNPEVDSLVADLHSSQEMVKKYEQLRGQSRINNEASANLESEKKAAGHKRARLKEKVAEAVKGGASMFRGNSRDGSMLGKTLDVMFRSLLDGIILELYPKLPAWSRPLKGNEALELLKAANLNGLSSLFYNGEQGLNLVVRSGQKYVLNLKAEVVEDVMDHLSYHHSYGNTEERLGKSLESHFGGWGYGGDVDMLKLVLAVLFRAGAVEVSSGGRSFDSYQDPLSHEVFAKNPAFRQALFTPARSPPPEELVQAVRIFEEISGETVDVDKSAIASAFKALADRELRDLEAVEARVNAEGLPVREQVQEFRGMLQRIARGSSYDCVNLLRAEGQSFKEALERAQRIREVTSGQAIAAFRRCRAAEEDMWPAIEGRAGAADDLLEERAQRLKGLLHDGRFYNHLAEMEAIALEISGRYGELYSGLHQERAKAYAGAVEEVEGLPEWSKVEEGEARDVLRELQGRACQKAELDPEGLHCAACRASIPQMESDLAALSGLKRRARARVMELSRDPEGPETESVSVKKFFVEPLDSEEAVHQAVRKLEESLLDVIRRGKRAVLE